MLLKTSGAKSKPVSMANFRDLLTHSCLDYPMETIVCKILLIMTCWQNTHRISDKKLHFGKWRSWMRAWINWATVSVLALNALHAHQKYGNISGKTFPRMQLRNIFEREIFNKSISYCLWIHAFLLWFLFQKWLFRVETNLSKGSLGMTRIQRVDGRQWTTPPIYDRQRSNWTWTANIFQ